MPGQIVRSLAFPVEALPSGLRMLLAEFRLLANRSIRIALREDIRSRARLTKVEYRTLSAVYHIYSSTSRVRSASPSPG